MKTTKVIFLCFFFLCGIKAVAQIYTPISPTTYGRKDNRAKADSAQHIPEKLGTFTNTSDTSAQIFYNKIDSSVYYFSKAKGFKKLSEGGSGGGGGGAVVFSGGVISSLPAIGNNPGSNITSNDFIISQFYASQPPTATLTGGGTFEYRSAGSGTAILNWGAGRQSATALLSTIVVDDLPQTFTQPAQGATVAGTKTVAITYNTNTNFTNTVTTTDNKIATATISILWQNKIYAGFVTSATPTDADIIAATGSSYVGGIFSASRNQSGTLTTPSSSKYFIFVSPASYGTPNIVINGLGATLNQTTRSFTNAGGFTSSYIIAVSPFQTSGQIDSYIVN